MRPSKTRGLACSGCESLRFAYPRLARPGRPRPPTRRPDRASAGGPAMITTRLTERFGLEAPIVSAPMAMAAGGRLAGAVSEAGGLGFIGGGYCDPEWIAAQFGEAGNRPWAVVLSHGPWMRPIRGCLTVFGTRGRRRCFCPLARLRLMWRGPRRWGCRVSCRCRTWPGRRPRDAGADVIVAQGSEAGGHGATRGTMSLVPEVVDAVGRDALVWRRAGLPMVGAWPPP